MIFKNYDWYINSLLISKELYKTSKRFINPEVIAFYGGKSMRRKTISIEESIPVEIYNELLDFGNGEVKDGIKKAVYLAQTMEVIQKSQMNESIEIWRRLFNN